ncbi:hypothetical protein [Vallitalea maricola]|uniref:Uncharacterized protein n=1 Tax=Vallitalea maricola TaxID=3074433 RepID=A0ACB5UF18_9FIRM|nr:hypothetical protein AN2V17_04230 [Vallitalea sp. AN17-2]
MKCPYCKKEYSDSIIKYHMQRCDKKEEKKPENKDPNKDNAKGKTNK